MFGEKGILCLVKTRMVNLVYLDLSNFNVNCRAWKIGNKGCYLLSKGNWPTLKTLDLSKFSLILDKNEIN